MKNIKFIEGIFMDKFINKILNKKLADNEICAWYLGQEGFLIKYKEKYIVFDPYLSDYVDKNCSDLVEWERLYPAPISGEDLDFIDYVVCTHAHYDHADPITLNKIASVNQKAKFIVPAPILSSIKDYGIEEDKIIKAYADKPIDLGEFILSPIPSAHEVFHTDNEGNYYELGYILDCDGKKIFHAGDMCMYEGLIERLTNITLGLLPINGRDYFRNQLDIIGNFNCEEVAILTREAKIQTVIPMHHDLYAVNSESKERFVEQIKKHNKNQKYKFLKVKQSVII